MFIADETSTKLDFVYGDSTLGAYFNTGLTAKTLIGLGRLGFSILKNKYLSRACSNTLFTPRALIFINCYFKHNFPPEVKKKYS